MMIKNSITVKLIAVGILVIVLMIPTAMITGLIQEREYTHNDAVQEVSSKWGDRQTIIGPILSVPFKQYVKNSKNELIEQIEYAHFLPTNLNVKSEISPKMLQRGIYDIVVYNSQLNLTGDFADFNFSNWNIDENNVIWKDAFVSLGISDMRGIKNNMALIWNQKTYQFNPGIDANNKFLASGVNVRVPENQKGDKKFSFSITINLNGSQNLNVVPVGSETNVEMVSTWNNPSFDGAFLPDERTVDQSGFKAKWKVLQLNRNYPQSWLGSTSYDLPASEFGVKLLVPVDEYQKTMRSVKYAIMLIALTFMIFFFVEVMNRIRVHPIQYLLVGFAICLFFTLLLAISEQTNFALAYLISSTATTVLIVAYSTTIFKNKNLSTLQGGVLILMYGFIYTILQLQDYALLMGSLGLFLVLAIVMYISRKIDWYGLDLGNKKK